MQGLEKIRILFIAGFGPIVRDVDTSRKLYAKALDIPFKEEDGGYLHTDAPSRRKGRSLFGHSLKPRSLVLVAAPGRILCRRPTLGWSLMWIASRAPQRSLSRMGYQMLLKNKKEPWGQTVSRFLDADGLLVGLTFTPWMREKK